MIRYHEQDKEHEGEVQGEGDMEQGQAIPEEEPQEDEAKKLQPSGERYYRTQSGTTARTTAPSTVGQRRFSVVDTVLPHRTTALSRRVPVVAYGTTARAVLPCSSRYRTACAQKQGCDPCTPI